MSGDCPTFMSGEFDLGDWHFKRFEPSNDAEPHEVHIVATNGTQTEREIVPLFHPNMWGLDVEDAAAINEAVEKMVTRLGLE